MIITACIPESMDFRDMERLVSYFFQDAQLLVEQEANKGLQLKLE